MAAIAEIGLASPTHIVPIIDNLLTDSDSSVRIAAGIALTSAPYIPEGLSWELIRAADDSRPDVRRSVAKLAATGRLLLRAEVERTCATLLSDSDATVRAYAIKAIGRIATELDRHAPALVVTLEDSDAAVREIAARTLGSVLQADSDVLAALRTALTDTDALVRHAAMESLRLLGRE